MYKLKLQFSKLLAILLVVGLTFLTISVANSQQRSLNEAQSQISAQKTTKYKLASELLSETGINKRYDMHFDHLIGSLVGKGDDYKLYARFKKMFKREIGWKHFQDAYAKRLETDFSEDELKELLSLSKQPLMKKLVQAEITAYEIDTSKQRFKMGYEFWNNYNEGKINLPED